MMSKSFPWILVALAAAWVLPAARTPSVAEGQPRIYDFARIPVVDGGRVKPMDTIARTYLRIMSNRESFKDKAGDSHQAIEWLLDVETEFSDKENRSRKHPVFRIDNQDLRTALGLQDRDGFRYSIEDFGDKLNALAEPLQAAHRKKEDGRTLDVFETHLFEFERHLAMYQRLADFSIPHVIAPKTGTSWRTLQDAAPKSNAAEKADPDVDSWRKLLLAYGARDAAQFNEAVAGYLTRIEQDRPQDASKARLEVMFNNWDPFNKAKWLYFIGFILAFLACLGWTKPLNNAAWGVMAFTFVIHTVALILRMHLSGRPPVTNLYSSAIFIGWGAVALGLLLERIYKLGIGNIVAAATGFTTLTIAYILSADGDTMEVLQAVLDTQFWLATHVTCITLGYATTYVAGLLGLIYIIEGVFTTRVTEERGRSLTRMIYGIVCFATFFSFIGTVLGGLWADDSWGRFWGWDPKENGALMIVLWNALLLHARWGGIARARGIAVLSVFGNVVVSWSWFGVNQLGVGLHSYGFTSGVALSLWAFAFSQIGAICAAMFVPLEHWKSAPKSGKAAVAPEGEGEHA